MGENDDKSEYMAFKFVAGSNFKMCHEKSADIYKKCADMQMEYLSKPDYREFAKAQDEYVIESCSARDDDGNIIPAENGGFMIDKEPDDEELKRLLDKYPKAKAIFNELNVKLKKYLNGKVTLNFETVELDKIPAKLSGSYLTNIKCMIR
jgi:sugar lactone lactonase YvrE